MEEPRTEDTGGIEDSTKMPGIHQLLKFMVDNTASDLHITPGTPPQLRIDGALRPLNVAPQTPP